LLASAAIRDNVFGSAAAASAATWSSASRGRVIPCSTSEEATCITGRTELDGKDGRAVVGEEEQSVRSLSGNDWNTELSRIAVLAA
jgi:hypothetical protein